MICPACNREMRLGEVVKCTKCLETYHYACFNITTANYMQHKYDYDHTWVCPPCGNITRRRRHDDTPVRNTTQIFDVSIMSTDEYNQGETSTLEQSVNTETLLAPNVSQTDILSKYPRQEIISLESIKQLINSEIKESLKQLIHSELKDNNKTIVTDLKKTIQSEINTAISKLKSDIKQETNTLLQRHKSELEEKINKISKDLELVKKENEHIKKTLEKSDTNKINITKKQIPESNSKKLVLYGLEEYYEESEEDLHNRLINIFRDFANVDLLGYIEETRRIGRRNNKRAIIIELISKRMVKYLIKNNYYFRNSGLSISEFLEAETLHERKKMREEMFLARKNGKHAIIRDGKLIVEGKIMAFSLNKTSLTNTQNNQETSRHHSLDRQTNNTFRN